MSNFVKIFDITMRTTVILSAALVLAIIITGCRKNRENSEKEKIASVYTFNPEGDSEFSSSSHTSVIEEGRSVNVAFKTGGQIKRLNVGEGAYVNKGQVLGYLDDVDYKFSLQQLETQYKQLASEVKRIEEMHRLQSVSDNDYEKALAGLQQVKIQLDMTKNQLSYTKLVAPISGHIVERYMEEGEMVGSGTPVFKIVDNSGLEVSVALSPAVYAQKDKIVKCTGQSSVTGDTEIPLEIISFIPEGDNNSLFRLRLKVPETYKNRLLPGMNMRVDIAYQSGINGGVYKIPSRALFERDGKTFVWLVNPQDSTLSTCEVKVSGAPQGNYSMVSGLSDTDEIVSVGVHHLSDKQKVKVIGKDSEIGGAAL